MRRVVTVCRKRRIGLQAAAGTCRIAARYQRPDRDQSCQQQNDLDAVDRRIAGDRGGQRLTKPAALGQRRDGVAQHAAGGDGSTRRTGLHGAPCSQRQSAVETAGRLSHHRRQGADDEQCAAEADQHRAEAERNDRGQRGGAQDAGEGDKAAHHTKGGQSIGRESTAQQPP